jgi:hypothetical protein
VDRPELLNCLRERLHLPVQLLKLGLVTHQGLSCSLLC